MTSALPGAAPDDGTPPLYSTGAEVGSEVCLRVATQTLRFRSASDTVRLYLHDNHAPFRVPNDRVADCEVTWAIGEVHPSSAPVTRRFETRWEIRALPDGTEEITFYNDARDGVPVEPSMQMVSDPAFTWVRIRQAPRPGGDAIAYVSEYPWAEYIIQRRLGLHGGVILHSSTAIWEGVAHIFLGHSGAGKSTIAELAEQVGARIPTDDRTIVTRSAEGLIAWGTPWHGSFRRTSPEGAPLGSISLLVQDATDRLDLVPPGRAIKEMFVRTVQSRITEREVQSTLDILETIAGAVPFYELRFRPTTAAVHLVLDAASRGRARQGGDVAPPQGLAR